MRYAPIPPGRTQCQWQAFRREAGKIVRDRRGVALREQCGHVARLSESFCWQHHDPSYRERISRRERDEVERIARAQARQRNRWTVERLAQLPENRQLDLFIWADAYEASASDLWLREIRAMSDEPRLEIPAIGDDRGWNRYLAESERRRQSEATVSARIHANARALADAAAVDHGMPSWSAMRQLIYDRDKATCFVCGRHVVWEDYHLGHLQDRVCGGSDHPNNLVVMCSSCNMLHKPLHNRREDAIEWARMTRAYHERLRAGEAAQPWSVDEAAALWSRLSDEERQALVRSALEWDTALEELRVELQDAEAGLGDG